MIFSTLPVLAALAAVSLAVPTPLTPATANIGATCKVQWDADPTGQWKDTTVTLKSGPNQAMTIVQVVKTGLDTTSTTVTEFDWICPDVTPTAAIYFYEFALANLSQPTWTTRFAIAAKDGTVVTPQYATQPNGDAIPWGNGALVGAASSNSTTSASRTGGSSSAGSATRGSTSAGSLTTSGASSASGKTSSSSSSSAAGGSTSTSTSAPTTSPTSSSSSSSSSKSATTTTTTGAASKQNQACALLAVLVGGAAVLLA